MPSALDGLTDAQRDAVTHRGTPLLVVGGPGTGKSEVLVRRVAHLAQSAGVAPHRTLVLSAARAAAEIRVRIEDALASAHEDLAVHTAPSLAGQILASEAATLGIDPFVDVVGAADRLAMLMERSAELELARHDFRGRPLALLASFVRRIDRLRAELVDATRHAAWAATLDGPAGEREREFATVFAVHDRMLEERGVYDEGALVATAVALLRADAGASARVAERHPEILVDDWQDRSHAERELVAAVESGGARLTAAGDDDQATGRARGAGAPNMLRFAEQRPNVAVVTLAQSFRCAQRALTAAHAVVAPLAPRIGKDVRGTATGDVRFWRAANERAQAQLVAAELERLIGREHVAPERCAVLVASVAEEGQPVAVALAERAIPHRVLGGQAFFDRTEVRDVLAWLRLLADPRDAPAAVRALARPPIELSSVDIARVLQISRRRRIDMIGALHAATESPQLAPEARERIQQFLAIARDAGEQLAPARADVFVHHLIERLGLRRNQLFTARADVVERLVNLARLGELAGDFSRRGAGAGAREFARYLTALSEAAVEDTREDAPVARAVTVAALEDAAGTGFDHVFVLGLHAGRAPVRPAGLARIPDALALDPAPEPTADERDRRLLYVAMTRAARSLVLCHAATPSRGEQRAPSPLAEEARVALGAQWEPREEELFGPDEALQSMFRERRDELLADVARLGTRLGELRFDTDLDVAHGVVRYLELVKLAALMARRGSEPLDDALEDVNSRLSAAVTPLQREVLQSSPIDDALLTAGADARVRATALAAREEPTLEAFLPRRGDGLVLSASDIETYRTCPLRYKFARVLRIPREPTLNQRFGILVHQVLERFHGPGEGAPENILALLDAGWRRGGFGDSDEERQLREKARVALLRYHERLGEDGGEPRWFERSFNFPLGRHQIRGRVDRVDELPGGGYELIDYKTGVPKRAEQLRDDIQLALYAVAAREAWQLEATERTYWYVLDDARVRLGPDDGARVPIEEVVEEVGAGILAQGFEPTPSHAVCAMCEYRIACPAAER